MRSPLHRWLSFRVKILCIAAFFLGSLLPPYVPRTAQAFDQSDPASQQFLFVEEGFLMKTSSLGVQGSRLAYSEGIVHHVQAGDSIETLAKRYNISADTIRWANQLSAEESLQPGQDLIILPVNGVLHAVRSGQTLASIAQIYNVPADTIARQNHIQNGRIQAGQELIVPGGKPVEIAGGAVTAGQLTFGNLSAKELQLKLNLPSEESPAKPTKAVAPAVGAAISQGILRWPCDDCTITQYFNASHYALDIQTPGGGPLFAAADGTVIRADYGWDGGYGNVIEIDHGNGLVTLYGHNKELYVKKGDHVKRGQKISWMGNTGMVHGPTGIHVHFEVRVNGVKKNPLLYLE